MCLLCCKTCVFYKNIFLFYDIIRIFVMWERGKHEVAALTSVVCIVI